MSEKNGLSNGASTLFEVLTLTLSFVIFGLLGTALISVLFGDLQNVLLGLADNNTVENRNIIRGANLINHLLTFSVAGLASAFFLFRSKWAKILCLNRFNLNISSALGGIVWVLVAMPFVQLSYWINKQLPLPYWASSLEESTKEMLSAILTMDSPMELLSNLFILAFLPAIGEEIIFRGFLVRWGEKAIKNKHIVVWVTAFLFSALHFQFEGFIPRFLLGAVLGYLFVWSRNLWVPIITHFAFNGMQVTAAYYMGADAAALDPDQLEPNWLAGITSLAVSIFIGILIKKNIKS